MAIEANRVKEIFLGATEQPDEAARAAYLDRACGSDAELRDRVEALLRSHDPAGSFLGSPAVKPPETNGATQELGLDRSATPDDGAGDLQFLSPSPRPDSLGRLGHYEMLQVLGRGGFGIVFRAFDDILQRVVAVKVMAPQIAALSPARKRFLREARSSAAVRHENVVQIYEIGEQPLPYLTMEFIPGETLQQKLDRSGPLDVPEVLRIGRQIAEGLAAAHACDLIHRDIKPGNILLEGGSHKAKITDFGLARAADDASISQSGVVAGTPMFMSPEQALGHHIDQRADLFSLGSVLYQMVSGRPPFRAPSALAVLKRVAEEPPRPIPEIIPETPDWLCGLIAKLHAKNPADRFQSAREVADFLADCEAKLKAKQEVKNVLPTGKTRDEGRGARGGKKWVAAAAVLFPVIALAVTEFAGVTHLFRQPAADPDKPGNGRAAIQVAKQQPTTDPIKPGGDPTPIVVPVAKQGPPPLAGAAKKGGPVIDLIPMAQPPIGPLGGNWKREGDTVVCTPLVDKLSQVLPFALDLPREYELEAVLERLAGNEGIGFQIGAFDSTFVVGLDTRTSKGNLSGLIAIAGKAIPFRENETGIRGARLGIGKQCTFRCTVRASGIVATLDDKLLFNYIGGLDKLDDDKTIRLIGTKLFISAWGNAGCKVHRLRLTELAPEDKTNAPPLVANKDSPPLAALPFDAAQAKQHQEAWAKHLGVPVEATNKIGMKLILIPPARVALPKAYYLGKYQVTQGEWENVMGYNPSAFGPQNPNMAGMDTSKFPVEMVSWFDSVEFCNTLSKREGWNPYYELTGGKRAGKDGKQIYEAEVKILGGSGYHISTESEWLQGCRAGTKTKYPFGDIDEDLGDYAWFEANSDGRTHAVGGKKPNAFGLYDMLGNVHVWTFNESMLTKDKPGVPPKRVARGGAWDCPAISCTPGSSNVGVPAGNRANHRGLRVARFPSAAPSPEAKTPPLAVAPFTDADVKRIAALPADEQVEEVSKELQKRNPDFDGKLNHKIEGDVVTELSPLKSRDAADISPVRALVGLKVLSWHGGSLSDLSPLKGLPLEHLTLYNTQVGSIPKKGSRLQPAWLL